LCRTRRSCARSGRAEPLLRWFRCRPRSGGDDARRRGSRLGLRLLRLFGFAAGLVLVTHGLTVRRWRAVHQGLDVRAASGRGITASTGRYPTKSSVILDKVWYRTQGCRYDFIIRSGGSLRRRFLAGRGGPARPRIPASGRRGPQCRASGRVGSGLGSAACGRGGCTRAAGRPARVVCHRRLSRPTPRRRSAGWRPAARGTRGRPL
jgi:hypothetical protein